MGSVRDSSAPVNVIGRIITGRGRTLADLFQGIAILEIEGEGRLDSYWVSLHLDPSDGAILGVRLQKFGEGTTYDLPHDLSSCECPDHQYRQRECKHMSALRQALTAAVRDNALPRQRPPRRVERDEATMPAPHSAA
jgi:hypothetical protein